MTKKSIPVLVPLSVKLPVKKQAEIFKAIITYCSKQSSEVTYNEVSNLTGLSATSGSSSLKFWQTACILQLGRYAYRPTQTLIDFSNAVQRDYYGAWKILKLLLTDQWFVTYAEFKLN